MKGKETEGEVLTVDLGGKKVFRLHFDQLEEDIDMDKLTQVDYSNIYAELITIPSLLNRAGIWKAQSENEFSKWNFDLDILEAEVSEEKRKSLKRTEGGKVKWPTVKELANAIALDEEVQGMRLEVIRKKKYVDYMDSIYWAIKSKSDVLKKIGESMKLSPEEFDRQIISDNINGILIKAYKKKYGSL